MYKRQVAIRQLSARHHTYEIVFYFLAVATLVAIPLMWNDFVVPATLREWGLLLAIGVVSLLGQVFLTRAFSHESATIEMCIRDRSGQVRHREGRTSPFPRWETADTRMSGFPRLS